MKKKSYNPFKLLGSWIGLIVFGLYGIGFCVSLLWSPPCLGFVQEFNNGLEELFNFIDGEMFAFYRFIIFGVIGFFIGWGIHSIIRKTRH